MHASSCRAKMDVNYKHACVESIRLIAEVQHALVTQRVSMSLTVRHRLLKSQGSLAPLQFSTSFNCNEASFSVIKCPRTLFS